MSIAICHFQCLSKVLLWRIFAYVSLSWHDCLISCEEISSPKTLRSKEFPDRVCLNHLIDFSNASTLEVELKEAFLNHQGYFNQWTKPFSDKIQFLLDS